MSWAPNREFAVTVLRDSCKVTAGSIGFAVVNTRALETLCALMKCKLSEYADKTRQMTEITGRTSSIVEDVLIAFKLLYVDVADLMMYCKEMRNKQWLGQTETALAKVLKELNDVPVLIEPESRKEKEEKARRAAEKEKKRERRAAERRKRERERELHAWKRAEVVFPNYDGMSIELLGFKERKTTVGQKTRKAATPTENDENDGSRGTNPKTSEPPHASFTTPNARPSRQSILSERCREPLFGAGAGARAMTPNVVEPAPTFESPIPPNLKIKIKFGNLAETTAPPTPASPATPTFRLRIKNLFKTDEVAEQPGCSASNEPLADDGVEERKRRKAEKRLRKEERRERKRQEQDDVGRLAEQNCSESFVEDEEVFYCPVCRLPYERDTNMVGCDACNQWYHWHCLGLTSEPNADDWYCPECSEKRNRAAAAAKKSIHSSARKKKRHY